jgi:protein-disulfide isomerase
VVAACNLLFLLIITVCIGPRASAQVGSLCSASCTAFAADSCSGLGTCTSGTYIPGYFCSGTGQTDVEEGIRCPFCTSGVTANSVVTDSGCPGGQGDTCDPSDPSVAPCLAGYTCVNDYCESNGPSSPSPVNPPPPPQCAALGNSCVSNSCCSGLTCDASDTCIDADPCTTDACSSTTCAGYIYCTCNPTDPSCGTGDDGGDNGGQTCYDVCDPNCVNYDVNNCYDGGSSACNPGCEALPARPAAATQSQDISSKKLFTARLLGVAYAVAISAPERPTACIEPSTLVSTSVGRYVFEKYHMASASDLLLLSNEQANDDCYWKYKFQLSPSKREIVLYLAPDRRYLTTTLYDRSLDPLTEEKQQRSENAKLLIAVNSASLGKKDASVTLVEFSDFECPFCQRLATMLETEILPNDPDVRVVFRNYPLEMHPWAEPAARITACAEMQSNVAFWMLHDYIFANQRIITAANIREKLFAVADAEPTLKREAFHTCVDDELTMGIVKKDVDAGNKFNVHSTPTIFVNGRRIEGVRDVTQLKQLIVAAHSENAKNASASTKSSETSANSK